MVLSTAGSLQAEDAARRRARADDHAVDDDSARLGGAMATLPTDDELVPRLRAGDGAAFRELVSCYHPVMVRVAETFVPSHAVAEEVTQDTWIAVMRASRLRALVAERTARRISSPTSDGCAATVRSLAHRPGLRAGWRERRPVFRDDRFEREAPHDGDPRVLGDLLGHGVAGHEGLGHAHHHGW